MTAGQLTDCVGGCFFLVLSAKNQLKGILTYGSATSWMHQIDSPVFLDIPRCFKKPSSYWVCCFSICSPLARRLPSPMISVFPLGPFPVTDSCSATLKDPDQTNKRRTERVWFVVAALQFLFWDFFCRVCVWAEVMAVRVTGPASALNLYYL